MKTVLLTGATGFLGSTFIEVSADDLASGELKIFAVSRNPKKIDKPTGIIPVSWDDLFAGALDDVAFDICISSAFPRSEDPSEITSGLEFLYSFFTKLKAMKVASVVNISSQSVYSQHRLHSADETTPLCLESAYAVAKFMTEKLVDEMFLDVPHTHIRLASLIGVGFDQRLPNVLAKKLLKSKLTIQERDNTFGYFDVTDAANGLKALVKSQPQLWKPIYVLGTDETCSITDVVQWIGGAYREAGVDIVPSSVISNPDENPVNTSLSAGSFRADFDWSPRLSQKQSVENIALAVKSASE